MNRSALVAALLAFGPGAALAHVTLEVQEAPQKSTYKAVLRIPHGCDGEATKTVRVQIPEGVIAVKPMPKAGWTLDIVKGAYAKSYDYYGTAVTEGVKELVWTGDLPDAYYDEFVFRGLLTDALPVGETVYFPVVQECAKGVDRWIEIPAKGQDPDELKGPAPGLNILAPAGPSD